MSATWVGEDGVVQSPHQGSARSIPEGSFTDLLLNSLKRRGDDVVLTDGVTGETLTASQLLFRGIRVASGLRRRGFEAGQVLSICMPNSLHFPVVFLASLLNGGIFASFLEASSGDDINRYLRTSESKWLVVGEEEGATVLAMGEKLAPVEAIFLVGPKMEGHVPFTELLQDDGDMYKLHTDIDPDKDVVALVRSSGTTGPSKMVMWTHTNFRNRLLTTRDESSLMASYLVRGLVHMSFSYMSGFLGSLDPFINDKSIVILPMGLPAERILQVIQEHKISTTFMAPPLVEYLGRYSELDQFKIPLRIIIVAGSALHQHVKDGLQKKIPGLEVMQFYGSTEAGVVTYYYDKNRPTSVGQVKDNVKIKVVDLVTREALGPNQEGELCTFSLAKTPGYYRNEAANKELFDKDGFLCTGDLAYYDEKGFLYIVNRISELIIYKGQKLKPLEVESLLRTHPCVQDAAVVGRPASDVGELPTAFIVTKPGAQVTKEQIQSFAAEQNSGSVQLCGGVVFLDAIPCNPTGKILRIPLRKMASKIPCEYVLK